MYAGRVACCTLMSHVDYALCALLRLEERRNRRTDGRTPDRYITHYNNTMLRDGYVIAVD